jgi:hypothetical protein
MHPRRRVACEPPGHRPPSQPRSTRWHESSGSVLETQFRDDVKLHSSRVGYARPDLHGSQSLSKREKIYVALRGDSHPLSGPYDCL